MLVIFMFGGVPHQRVPGSAAHVAEQHDLGERAGVVEVRDRLPVRADRVEPVLLVARRASGHAGSVFGGRVERVIADSG
jgi:hypothetical protein